ncbi:MAG: cytochrome-c oxidase, cbb3-type subunit I [Myxococcales bacterium]|nr:cytochrome-c oxidase, cbb3-type subunit I [Myxococcales bacterium]
MRKFVAATLLWAVVGMLVGLILALQLVMPALNFGPWFTFGRLRPLHTNAVIFAFAGNALFAGIYHSSQRLLKTRMFSDALSRFHFWGWQAIIVSAAITLPLGFTQGKEYAELEWPIDIAIAVVWVAFAVNFFGTLAKRRERHLYVAIWFYIATIITVAVLHIFNNLAIPAGALKSYPIYAGVQDAFMQWWYGHNAVAFFLTTPFLGMMYYYLPKAAERPVYSYRLSILHFWSLVFLYIWAGPHHLHYTALPEWASTLGMLFSVMLWMPSWGGMINGLFTLRGAWHRVAQDPVLKFFVVAVTFYGMATFEGPLLSIKSVNSLSHYTDWTIGHVHGGALGWNGFLAFGMIYWLAPRLFQTKIYSKKMMEFHFWTGTIGILIYIISMYVAGITQGLMWRAFNADGTLKYDFMQSLIKIIPMYWFRAFGGLLYITGVIVGVVNIALTWASRPKVYEDKEIEAPALKPITAPDPEPPSPLKESGAHVVQIAYKLERFIEGAWHRTWERLPLTFSVMVGVAVVVASLFEILPTFLIRSNVPTIASVEPLTPLEQYGRDIYISDGCYNCHSQMVRPIRMETERYKPDFSKPGQLTYSLPGEFVYDHPFQWGSRRIGPDLHRVGRKYSHDWHWDHMMNPRSKLKKSMMPPYDYLFRDPIDFSAITDHTAALVKVGVPYIRYEVENADKLALWQAKKVAGELTKLLKAQNRRVPPNLQTKKIIAVIAYLQRLGTDIFRGPKDIVRPWLDPKWRREIKLSQPGGKD